MRYFKSVHCFSIFLTFSILTLIKVSAVRVHYIHWNASSPIFRDPRSSHVIEIRGGRRDQPWDYEQANIICPFYRDDSLPFDSAERYVIYNVTREEFNSCRLKNESPKIVALCDRPFKPNFFTLTFRPFSPIPGAFEFKPGQDYFFISTSSQRDLYQKSDGRCRSHNMRLVFRIRDVDFKDVFQSVDDVITSTDVLVAQPRSDDDVLGDYDEVIDNKVASYQRKEKSSPVISSSLKSISSLKLIFVLLSLIRFHL